MFGECLLQFAGVCIPETNRVVTRAGEYVPIRTETRALHRASASGEGVKLFTGGDIP